MISSDWMQFNAEFDRRLQISSKPPIATGLYFYKIIYRPEYKRIENKSGK
jgi:hypothetical protein